MDAAKTAAELNELAGVKTRFVDGAWSASCADQFGAYLVACHPTENAAIRALLHLVRERKAAHTAQKARPS